MIKISIIQLVEKHCIKKSNKYYDLLDHYCYMSKNLYNFANYHIRQSFTKDNIYLKLIKKEMLIKKFPIYLKI